MSKHSTDDLRSIRRRKVLRTAGVLGSGTILTGTAAASQPEQSDIGFVRDEIDTSDWEVTIESIDGSETAAELDQAGTDVSATDNTGRAETYVYIGPNKNAEPGVMPGRSDDVSTASIGGTKSIVTFDIPDVVPIVGSEEASVDVTAELGLSGVDAGIDLCIAGECVSIGGFSLDLFQADLIRVEVKGVIKGVPFEIEGAISASASRDGWTPQLELGGSLQLCLGRDLCDSDDEEDGWESISCQLCKDGSVSGSFP